MENNSTLSNNSNAYLHIIQRLWYNCLTVFGMENNSTLSNNNNNAYLHIIQRLWYNCLTVFGMEN